MKITAVSGWAIPTEWFSEQIQKYFVDSEVNVIYPSDPFDSEEARIKLNEKPADLYLGYSLGSLWMFRHRHLFPKTSIKAVLAPILAFTKEHDMGGKTTSTQLNYLIKLLQRNDNENPLVDFYANCDIPFPRILLKTLPSRSILIKGLEFLQSVIASKNSVFDFKVIVGENDIFLDAIKLKNLIPQTQIVTGAGHAPDQLLSKLARTLNQ
ncbi:MAG: hypothetical protein P8I98_10510 [Nitrospinaceae bacterium]|jgi:hypothetical protein|nr:hypothetical protein [Nitrospinaceae bacterium]|tara:strand:+ start:414 stop:1043 length:630 start_codon:yes stop_codon:yes gene_type:complete